MMANGQDCSIGKTIWTLTAAHYKLLNNMIIKSATSTTGIGGKRDGSIAWTCTAL